MTAKIVAMCIAMVLCFYAGRLTRPSRPGQSVVVEPGRSQAPLKKMAKKHPARAGWATLGSDNPSEYATHLKEAGCPEEAVCDIVRGEVFASYQAKVNQVFNPLARYWQTAAEAEASDAQVAAIRRERDAVVAQLGLDCSKYSEPAATPGSSSGQDIHIAEALKLYPKVELRPDSTPDERLQANNNRKARVSYLQQFLSPRELLDYRIAQDGEPSSTRIIMSGLNPTDDEFRNVFNVMDGISANFTNGSLAPELEAQLHQALGDARYTEYRQEMDHNNLSVRLWGRTANLSDDEVNKLIAIRNARSSMTPNDFRDRVAEVIRDRGALSYFLAKEGVPLTLRRNQ
jgi:hypothetical protein